MQRNKEMMLYINTPPPTISGNLHIGHVFSYTHIDVVNRAMKYLGKEVHFPIGFDCNGIPTENLLRRNPEKTIDIYLEDYFKLFQRMGLQMDFKKAYKTLDLTKEANQTFDALKDKGLIYEAEKEVWFDTALKTPLSDTEVIEQDDGSVIGEVSKKPVVRQLTKQYFLKTVEFKEELLALANALTFHPLSMRVKLLDWIENLNQDWCISRDRSFGIKIGETDKVFDTWFVSGLSHKLFAERSDFHFQSHEIIRSWCFYSLVLSMHLTKDLPFTDVFISGWCLGKDGQKFSKSKGNFIDPNKLLDQYGVNPIRFWACKANWGTDTYFDENVVLNGRRLIVKLENAERFFVLKLGDARMDCSPTNQDFKQVKQEFDSLLEQFNISSALNYLYEAFFHFCSTSIEECKVKNDSTITLINYQTLLEYKRMFSVFFNL